MRLEEQRRVFLPNTKGLSSTRLPIVPDTFSYPRSRGSSLGSKSLMLLSLHKSIILGRSEGSPPLMIIHSINIGTLSRASFTILLRLRTELIRSRDPSIFFLAVLHSSLSILSRLIMRFLADSREGATSNSIFPASKNLPMEGS